MFRALSSVTVVAVVVLAGCASPTSGEGEPPPGTMSGVPGEIPSGPVATGDILLADGSVFGEATLTWDGEKLGVEVPDLVALFGDEQSLVALSDGDIDFDTCGADNAWQVGFGDEATMAGLPMPNAKGDPSYFRYLLVMPYWRAGEPCVEPIIGVLNLDPENRGDSETRRPGSELSQSDAFE